MPITVEQSILIIGICAGCTFLERLLPFLIFRKGQIPSLVRYLGKVLPLAIMATLVVYCLRGTTFDEFGNFVPQTVAVAVTTVLHLWKGNTLLSVIGGTVVYMWLVQMVF
ncbi:MAG: AzlD domain-containing protein [Lachnospiraceae bacterium]|nr:AzlD domain-containing protein [Lachnospiraceae bacterium]